MDIDQYIANNHLKIIVKPNSPKTEIIKYDTERKALIVNIHAKPEDNKANLEIIKFFRKLLKKKVSIKTGLKNKEKILLIS
jgi:uncharacterized protein